MTITVTPDLLSTPPRNIVQVSSGVGSVMQSLTVYRTDHEGKAPLRTQPVAGFESRTVDDFFCPYEEAVTYSWDATYLSPATNVFAETWASLAAWTQSGASWAVSAGTVVWSAADSLVAFVQRAVTSGRYRAVFSAVPKGIQKIDFGGFYVDVQNNKLVLGAASQSFVPGTTTWTIDVTPTSVTIVTSAGSYSVAGVALVTQVKFLGPVATYAFNAAYGSAQFAGGAAGVAVDSSGNVFVVDTGGNRVLKFNSAGVYQSQFGTAGSGNGQFSNPYAIAIDASNNIFVTDLGNFRVQKFNSAGTYQLQVGSSGTGNGQFTYPQGIAIDGSGNVFVSDAGGNRIQKFNTSLAYQSQFGSTGSTNGLLLAPYGLAFDASGNIWVADNANNRVQKFNSAGVYQSQFAAVGARGLAFDSLGNMIVGTSQGAYRLQKYSQAGDLLQPIAPFGTGAGAVGGGVGVAVGSGGDVWVGDGQARVQRFTRTVTSITPVTLTAYGSLLTISGETSLPVTLACHDTWLIHPQSPSKSMKLQNVDPMKVGIRTFGAVENPSNANLHYILGSKTPVQSNSGPRQDDITSITIPTVTSADRVALRTVLADDLPLLIQVPPSWLSDFNCGFYSFGDPTEARRVDYLSIPRPWRMFDCSITKVQPPVVDVENSGWSWAQLAAEFATWDQVLATFATWDDLAANIRS